MLIDDVPENLKLLHELLQSEGYRIVPFTKGSMALKAAKRQPPDLILLDITMPEMSGFEVCGQLKQDDRLQDVPVLFISALNDSADKIAAFSAGGVDYITKPFQEKEVLARVKTHLKLHGLQMELEKHNLHLESMVLEKVKEISDSQIAIIMALSQLAEHRDEDTGAHIERTRIYCKKIAEKLRDKGCYLEIIDDAFIMNLYYAAPLHDVGKIIIPDAILLKPAKLSEEEFKIMKTHAAMGALHLLRVKESYPQNAFITMGIDLTRSHHEKWDGAGYPDGLFGQEIPLSGRIMALADVYDALRSKRPYKEAFSHEKSSRIILEDAGAHFDPLIVEAFISLEVEFDAICASTTEKAFEK